jgi:DNA-binding response OmpR family regulator
MKGKRILIVEDSKVIHKIYEIILQAYDGGGGGLLHAYDAVSALRILGSEPRIDMIILDTTLPDMSGIELLCRLKASASCRDIPVIIVSTEGQDHHIQRGLEAGAYAYITKPFRPQPLVELIHQIFMLREGSAAPPSG